jgi:hypothetical protein
MRSVDLVKRISGLFNKVSLPNQEPVSFKGKKYKQVSQKYTPKYLKGYFSIQ